MPTYGKVKVDTITYDLSGTATDVSVADIATKASPTFTGTITGVNLTLSGDLTVNGTTTTIDTTTLQVEDKNIEIGKVSSPSDTTADGGGWTLKGATDKTFNWVNATDAWTSSEHIQVYDNKKFILGLNADLSFVHDGTNSLVRNAVGDLQINAGNSAGNVEINLNENIAGGTKELAAKFIKNGACELYYDNSKKIETTTAGVTVTGTVSDSKGDLRKIIQNTQGSAYTLVAADAGKHILASGNITIPNSVFAAGDGVVIVNNTSGDLTITSGITNLYLGTDGSTGNKTLASRCTCTVLFTSGTAGYISGGGLS